MIVDLPEELAGVLTIRANARGVSPAGYVCEILKRDLAAQPELPSGGVPFKTGRGTFAKYGQAPSSGEIEANQAEMFQNFGERF